NVPISGTYGSVDISRTMGRSADENSRRTTGPWATGLVGQDSDCVAVILRTLPGRRSRKIIFLELIRNFCAGIDLKPINRKRLPLISDSESSPLTRHDVG